MDIQEIYNKVIEGSRYDYDVASAHHKILISQGVCAAEMPRIEEEYLKQNHVGCCLHFGMYLFKKMREQGYNCFIAITVEENPKTHEMTDNHVSVCYSEENEWFIADPVKTLKEGVDNCYKIPITDFWKAEGTIWLFDPYGEYGTKPFYTEFLNHPLKILSGEEDIQKLSKLLRT